jgi:hypothetical protein
MASDAANLGKEMLAIVERQQNLLLSEKVSQRVKRWEAVGWWRRDNLSDGLRDQLWLRERRQFHEPDTAGELVASIIAARSESRVLPTPPAPVNVTS